MKKALITGVTGQDGSYLAEFLLHKGYEVHGIKRRSSSFNTGRVDSIYTDLHEHNKRFFLHFGDLSDTSSLWTLLYDIRPDEVYNLAAQSPVRREGGSSDDRFPRNGHAKDAEIEQGKGNQHGLKPQWDSHWVVLSASD